MTVLMEILKWVAIVYPIWMLCGYTAFRMVNRTQKGRRLCSNHFWDDYSTGARVYWPLTPSVGLRYTMIWGFPGLVVCTIIIIARKIAQAWRRQFSKGFDASLGANRFFGIK